jgi:ABC-2 type transport system ATP-binding protein
VSVITTEGLTMQFGSQRALDDLDVEVPNGVTGLVGANGAGKTTLMSILLGLRPATSGSATVLGLDPVTQGAELRAVVGYGPERNLLPEDMPASDFVKHLAEVRGLPKDEARGRASDALWLVGLGEERFRPLGSMSTGQRQRVKLAQAIAADPSLIFLDEPTDGLDPVQRDEMLSLIRQISAEYAIDVVLSSHLLEEVERICDNVVALDAGRLVANGRLDDLVGNDEGVVVELVDVADRPGAIDQVARVLTDGGLEVRRLVRPGEMEVIGPDVDLVADSVRDAIADAEARVGRIVRRRRRLEDLFHTTREPLA